MDYPNLEVRSFPSADLNGILVKKLAVASFDLVPLGQHLLLMFSTGAFENAVLCEFGLRRHSGGMSHLS